MTRVLQIALVAGGLLAILLAGAGEAIAASPQQAASTSPLVCSAARPAFADFDGNDLVGRVDSGVGSRAAGMGFTLNGRQRVHVEAASACRLNVLDVDYDRDIGCDVPAAHPFVLPFECTTAPCPPGAVRPASNDSSASRAPPAD